MSATNLITTQTSGMLTESALGAVGEAAVVLQAYYVPLMV
jgi:hypothetical protein